MDSVEIYKALFRYYGNYEYKLSNSYIFNWESDFHAISKAGYCMEIEVKVSRNDYFRDFAKAKHRLFADAFAGKKYTIHSSAVKGDLICSFVSGHIQSLYGEYARILSYRRQWQFAQHNSKFGVWANDYGMVTIRQQRHEIYAQATRILFRLIEKLLFPNQIYFACPTNLIKEDEVPVYAGLLYCDGGIHLVRKAPYLHKRKLDLTKILLRKFYQLWEYKQSTEKQIEIAAIAAAAED